MRNRIFSLAACLLCLAQPATAQLHHDLQVSIDPDTQVIEVRDSITLDAHRSSLNFTLHPAFSPVLSDAQARLTLLPASDAGDAALAPKRYQVKLAAGMTGFTLRYRGRIHHALQRQGEEYARGFQQTPGMISSDGVFLAASSFWYPRIDDELMVYDLELRLPAGWSGMSQGQRRHRKASIDSVEESWRCTAPQEEIYLIAGRFAEFRDTRNNVTAMVLLREPDAVLAQKYIDATHRYIGLYRELIGPYPFGKFALVENFWETGYGMPSFTLLGSRVIRFPFILHSSYPHEILHNWWGNGVYVDYRSGNWAEGLTSYLADHLIKEQRDDAVEYRRTVLQKYTDYVDARDDFPLTAFRGRHSARTEAVGYGKTLMLFHMLRLQLGDQTFIKGLRELYDRYLFRTASFRDVQRVFSEVAEQPLDDFFTQWVARSGAPLLKISQARAAKQGDSWRLTAAIEQTQPGDAYTLRVPVAIHLEGAESALQTEIVMRQKHQPLQLELPTRPLRLDIDPEFDLFRRLHRNEIPPSVSQAIGASRVLVVLPSQAAPGLLRAYRRLAETWRKDQQGFVEVATDDDLQGLPDDRAVWLFGWNNRFRPLLRQALRDYDFEDPGDGVRVAGTALDPGSRSVALLARQPRNPDHALGWLAAHSAAALPGLARKLPHYGRYSYLVFSGTAPDNVLKGQWPVVNSPMSIRISQSDGTRVDVEPASLAPRQPLVAPADTLSVTRMQRD